MAFVEDDRMPQIDRPAVVRLVGDEIEERARSCAVPRVPVGEEAGEGTR